MSAAGSTLSRSRYLLWGLGLSVFKVVIDAAVSLAFGRECSPLVYVMAPGDSPLSGSGAGDNSFFFALWATALPFIIAGLILTDCVRVLRHTRCSHLAIRGASAKVIQEFAGHRDVRKTMCYVHALGEGC